MDKARAAEYEFRMHPRGGSPISLADVLDSMPANSWTWILLEFDGVGIGPIDLIGAGPHPQDPRELSWLDLKRFAGGVADTWWFLAAAVEPEDDLALDEKLLARAIVWIRGFDSSTWEFSAPRQTPEGLVALEGLRVRFDAALRPARD